MRNRLIGLGAFSCVAASSLALAQQASVVTAPPHAEGRSAGLDVVVEPARGHWPSWCPSTDFNGARIRCQSPSDSAVPAERKASPINSGAYDVTLRLGEELVWKGTMFLEGEGGNAIISQNRTDSFRCQPEPPRMRASHLANTSFSIRLGGYQPTGRLAVVAEITRPLNDPRKIAVCADRGLGTKTIRFETEADLAGDSPVVLTGDAGMTLSIARLAQ